MARLRWIYTPWIVTLCSAVMWSQIPINTQPPEQFPGRASTGLFTTTSAGLPAVPNSRQESQRSEDPILKRTLHRIECDQLTIQCENPTERHWKALLGWLLPIAATGAFIPADKHISSHVPAGWISGSRTFSNVGFYGSMGVLGSMGIAGMFTRERQNSRLTETAVLAGESLANSAFVYVVANIVAGRERPETGLGKGLFWRDHSTGTSFPSGHSTMTFAMDTVIAHEYPSSKWFWYPLAAATAAARVTGRKHFPSDVIAGGLTGIWFGRHVFKAHNACDNPDNNDSKPKWCPEKKRTQEKRMSLEE